MLSPFAGFFFHQRPKTTEEHMAKKLYVGNLSYNMTEDDMRDAFGKIGEVLSAKIITDQETGRSKGFGFVEMANDEDGDKAISSLNGTSILDRTITVSEARPQKDRPRSGFGGGGGGGRGRSGGGGFGGGKKNNSWR
jgi:RNA recognition motif-containing protein